jgi:mono/diheme cytochrome c family protein
MLTLAVVWPSLADDKDTKKTAEKELDKDHAAKMARGLDVFKQHVRPVLVEQCLRCHGGKKTEAGFDLSDRDRLLKGGEAGPAILVGRGKDSLLVKMIAHQKEPYMPEGGKQLSAEIVAKFSEWIDNGAPYDASLIPRKDEKAWTSKVVPAEAKQHWAFQPLKRVEPPTVKDAAWCNTPIDRFIRAPQETAGVTPNAPVDRRRLIRRVYFDLIGLPPTPEEVEAFVNDKDPEAYPKLLDKLLESPHYGERWARHWLDLARFAESHGFEHDYDRPTAYHYRDFVIKALNDGMPYDRFVKWQIAGDEYAPNDPLALAATGFLAAGVHSTQITANEAERHRYDETDDQLATIGTAILGLTVGCARCHDHKYDPIPQRDYYRLLSTFTTTVRSEVDLKLDAAAYQKALAAWDKDHAPLVAALRKYEGESLPARLAEWEKASGGTVKPPWTVLDLTEFKSQGGATLKKLDDGSVLATGTNPDFDTYIFQGTTDLTGITAVRIEALADPSMVKGGPGRAGNGNFALSDLKVTARPIKGSKPDIAATPLKLRNARATFEQRGLPVAAVIDADEKSAWAVDPQFGKNHAAVFEIESPLTFDGGAVLTFTLKFNNNNGHNIGRPRLSITTLPSPAPLDAEAMPTAVATALRIPAEKRTREQTTALLAWYRNLDPEWRKINQPVQEHLAKQPKPTTVKALICSEGVPALRLHTQGIDFYPETYFLRRGDTNQKDGVAAQGFLQVLMPTDDSAKKWQSPAPAGGHTSYRRHAFAEWLTDVEGGAGNLLARVIVNRLWQRHMGRGIVSTVSDFGIRGEAPTHPELLDWLATELIKEGWKLKPIHKRIMTSAVYLQDSTADESRISKDRENRLFWRHPVRRLEGEVIRDSLLAVGGQLDERMYGPGTLDEGMKRRSIYFTVKRSKLIPMLVVFDAPEALSSIGERPTTTIAPQALYLMNNPHVREYAHGFAKRIAADAKTPVADAVRRAYLTALGRQPTAVEISDAEEFIRSQTTSYETAKKADARTLALTDFCQTLLCLNEFVYVE